MTSQRSCTLHFHFKNLLLLSLNEYTNSSILSSSPTFRPLRDLFHWWVFPPGFSFQSLEFSFPASFQFGFPLIFLSLLNPIHILRWLPYFIQLFVFLGISFRSVFMLSFVSMNGFIIVLLNSLSGISSRPLLLRNLILGWAESGGDMSCFVLLLFLLFLHWDLHVRS